MVGEMLITPCRPKYFVRFSLENLAEGVLRPTSGRTSTKFQGRQATLTQGGPCSVSLLLTWPTGPVGVRWSMHVAAAIPETAGGHWLWGKLWSWIQFCWTRRQNLRHGRMDSRKFWSTIWHLWRGKQCTINALYNSRDGPPLTLTLRVCGENTPPTHLPMSLRWALLFLMSESTKWSKNSSRAMQSKLWIISNKNQMAN